ncbi:hypothetical protein RHMOL_Rhmol06G0210500 [Rhododendron molle]|uniref:Uncharacterized protein n=1 Tax=Rhododendron molle TaxID=49168 RepID=A0ACC0NG88_RHOML|nr:hypothetical protein RHMOL_Rhmol06G0210500 [Rhododendron molle]
MQEESSVLAELHDRVNEERLAMGAVIDAAARFSDICVIPICNKKDLHLPLRDWPIKLVYPTAMLGYAQPLAQLRALATLCNLEIVCGPVGAIF